MTNLPFRTRTTQLGFLLIIVSISSCAIQQKKHETHNVSFLSPPERYPYTIVSTTAMISDLLENIVNDQQAKVQQLIPNGLDPHTYLPGRSDVVIISEADLIVYNGLHLEGSLNNVLVRLARKKNIISIATLLKNLDTPYELGEDPHIWMNALLWNMAGREIVKLLADFDPRHSKEYHEQFEQYSMQLSTLHEYISVMLSTIPEQTRILITSHDAFQHFSKAYDFQVFGIQGISTVSEASLNYINFLVSFIIQKEIPMIFVESSVSSKYVQVLIEGVRSHGRDLGNGGYLFADAMGLLGSYEGTYIGMMDYNARTITKALQGTVEYSNFFEYLAEVREEDETEQE